jgi:hypothetical protein
MQIKQAYNKLSISRLHFLIKVIETNITNFFRIKNFVIKYLMHHFWNHFRNKGVMIFIHLFETTF